MENATFTSWLDRIFSLWNNDIHCMNFWVCAAGTYRTTSILGTVHAALFNYHQFNEMTHIPDKIVLARIMTVLDLEFERALHYHDEGYEVTMIMEYQLRLWGLYVFIKSQHSTMSHLSLHMVTQGWVAFLSRGLPNLWKRHPHPHQK